MDGAADEDMSRLLDALLPFAEESLARHGGFFPFGASISTTGQVLLSGVDVTEDMPSHDEIERSMTGVFLTLAADGAIRAAGICTNVELGGEQESGSSAVRFALEQVHGVSIECFLPYALTGGVVSFGEIAAHEKPVRFFGS